jgi:glycosyltransferase involved in cell wall biosynthesis
MPHKPTLLFLADIPGDGKIKGGAQSAACSLIEGLKYYIKDVNIYVVSFTRTGETENYFNKDGINYYYLKSVKNIFQRPRLFWNIYPAIKIIKKISPDAINVIDNPAFALAASYLNIPKAFTVHGIKKIEANLWKGEEFWSHQLEKYVERFIHNRYDNFIVISPLVKDLLTDKFGDKKKFFEIPNAVSEFYLSDNLRQETNDIVLLNIGSYSYLKSQHILLEALLKLQKKYKIKCICCGSVDDEVYFKKLKEYEKSINDLQLLTLMDKEKIKQLMISSNLLVHTSKQENMPMVFYEAIACKLPVISSRVGGVSYLLQNDSFGTTYDFGDVDQIVNIVEKYITQRQYFEAKSNNAYEFLINNNHPKIVAEKTINSLITLIK